MITKYPDGLLARTDYFRVNKQVWDNQEVKDWIISRIKVSANNIKPIIIIDEVTKKCTAELVNTELDGFEPISGGEVTIYCRRVESIADWHLNKLKVQMGNPDKEFREEIILFYKKRDLYHEKLTTKEVKTLKDLEEKL